MSFNIISDLIFGLIFCQISHRAGKNGAAVNDWGLYASSASEGVLMAETFVNLILSTPPQLSLDDLQGGAEDLFWSPRVNDRAVVLFNIYRPTFNNAV